MNRIVSVTWGTWHLLIVHLADIDINASGLDKVDQVMIHALQQKWGTCMRDNFGHTVKRISFLAIHYQDIARMETVCGWSEYPRPGDYRYQTICD